MAAGKREAGMLQDCIITSWPDSAGVFTPSLPIQDPSLPDCHGTRYSVYLLDEAAESDAASRRDGEPRRGSATRSVRRPVALQTGMGGSSIKAPLLPRHESWISDRTQQSRPLC